MKTLILILIVYIVLSQLLKKNRAQIPSPAQQRQGEDAGRLMYADLDDDVPLRGPWSRLPENPAPQGGETVETGTIEPVPEPLREAETPRTELPRKQRQLPAKPEKTKAAAAQKTDNPGAPSPIAAIGDNCVISDEMKGPVPPRVGKRKKDSKENPLLLALCNRNALVGSIILGEVLNTRGGRRPGRPPLGR